MDSNIWTSLLSEHNRIESKIRAVPIQIRRRNSHLTIEHPCSPSTNESNRKDINETPRTTTYTLEALASHESERDASSAIEDREDLVEESERKSSISSGVVIGEASVEPSETRRNPLKQLGVTVLRVAIRFTGWRHGDREPSDIP